VFYENSEVTYMYYQSSLNKRLIVDWLNVPL